MRQVVVERGSRTPVLSRAPRPAPADGEALVRTLAVGLDGTDAEVLHGGDDRFPPGEDALVLGHECLGEVVEAPEGAGLATGDRVVPLVRHACGVCAMCDGGRVDMCASGRYREHGIRGLHGFLRELWADDPRTLVKVPEGLDDLAVLTEPLSIVVKALDVARGVQQRVPGFSGFEGKRALLAGTGSLGMLAAFLLRDEGVEAHAFDRSGEEATSSRLLASLGVRHFNSEETGVADYAREVGGFDLVLEATGAPKVAFETTLALRENGIMVLLGVPREKPAIRLEADDVMRSLVLKNQCVVGSVNSNARHFALAMQRLLRFRGRWPDAIERVITHRHAPEDAPDAIAERGKNAVKEVVDFRRGPPA
jgi:threonine dehydrogenase-like Zn-dependent dehydrogenase